MVRIVWNEGTVGEWDRLFLRAPRSTLPQSFGYAQAMAKTAGYVPRLGVIEADGRACGLVQVLERRYARVFRQTQLYRGPLWFDAAPEPALVEASLRLLRREFPDHLLHRFAFLPELPAAAETSAMLDRCGFRAVGPGYRTVWLDLSRSDEELRGRLARDWRKRLKAAEKAGLAVDLDPAARNLPWFLVQKQAQSAARGYRTTPGPVMVRLRNALHRRNGVLLATAHDAAGPVAGLLVFGQGATATCQLIWSNDAGRDTHAMRLLLWRSLGHLRGCGYRWLDLGGLSADADGVNAFKLGTGGEVTETVGLYR